MLISTEEKDALPWPVSRGAQCARARNVQIFGVAWAKGVHLHEIEPWVPIRMILVLCGHAYVFHASPSHRGLLHSV